jgi:hypothetical protein
MVAVLAKIDPVIELFLLSLTGLSKNTQKQNKNKK